ncbi:Rhodanese-like domain-containing protein [Talaromyces proteolyticus]|uniref:Rhodanese-like domain-containing protein n=1 Tax=Talaromyces proteolyticus TaxID=1131652 RepID=A0AAD4Q2H8_9EURO|nr:Rhodanese-like domain-containing protein [Talaromyces proteolyticus]KAH8700447.1 Rhodanese-like domain-containing protein [Talaromyces proteolyticus]
MSAIQSSLVSLARRNAGSSFRASARFSFIPSRSRTCTALTRHTPLRTSQHPRSPTLAHQSWRSLQYRTYSSQDNGLKQIGFDDINTSLSASSSSTPSKLILIDVREPAELIETGIIPGAVSVPLASQPDAYFLSPEEFETRFGYPKPGAGGGEIVFYCKAGVRARAAAQLAAQAGYDAQALKVYDGSWLDWMSRGGKVERWEGGE